MVQECDYQLATETQWFNFLLKQFSAEPCSVDQVHQHHLAYRDKKSNETLNNGIRSTKNNTQRVLYQCETEKQENLIKYSLERPATASSMMRECYILTLLHQNQTCVISSFHVRFPFNIADKLIYFSFSIPFMLSQA